VVSHAICLSNALSVFMRVMTQILYPYLDRIVVFYFDDIVLSGRTQEEHLLQLIQVLGTLHKEKLCQYEEVHIHIFIRPLLRVHCFQWG